jgi:aminoglycoside phosphotransferase (APT) family kinase protein
MRVSLERGTLGVLAALHELSAGEPVNLLYRQDDTRTSLRRHVDEQRDYYAWVASDGTESPLIERGFQWLEEHWPEENGEPVFNWGDARIGNIVFREFAPVAVLDWEMASIGPRELDIGWMVYTHRFFQDLAEDNGLPGLPHMFRRSAVAAYYEHLTEHALHDLDFYTTYGALRHAIVMFRIARRQAKFGEATFPENPDHAILYHAHLRRMLDGAYWATVTGA